MEPEQMTKLLADKIFELTIEGQRLNSEKYEIQRALGLFGWEEVCTAAMKYLMEAKNVHA